MKVRVGGVALMWLMLPAPAGRTQTVVPPTDRPLSDDARRTQNKASCDAARDDPERCRGVEGQETLEPDRPDVTNGTHIVDTGLLQIEVGGLYTHPAAAQHAVSSPMTARMGVFEWLELRFGSDGFLRQSDGMAAASGIGNVQAGAKLRLWEDPGGIPVLSILPTVNLPTADSQKGLGSGKTDFTIALLTGTDIGSRSHVDINYGIGAIGAEHGASHFTQHLVSASASVAANEHWNPYAETFWFSRQDAQGSAVTAFDVGAIYTVNPKLAFDGGVQLGLSENAPAVAGFGGVSIIVGDVAGNHGVHARHRGGQAAARKRRH